MYGNYVPNEDAETDTGPTEFNVQQLIESSRRFKKKDQLKSQLSTLSKPVRWNTGSKPKLEQPIRMNATGKRVAEKYQESMKSLDDDLNSSFLEDPQHKMLETPRHTNKPSPDTGSFTEDMLRTRNGNDSYKVSDADGSLLRLFQPLSLNTPLSTLQSQAERSEHMDKMERLSRIEDLTRPGFDRDSGSFTSDTSGIQERNVKMELFAEYKPNIDTSIQPSNITQPTRPFDTSKFQPVRMRREMPVFEPVRRIEKENYSPEDKEKTQEGAKDKVKDNTKLSIKERLEALSGREVTHPSKHHQQPHNHHHQHQNEPHHHEVQHNPPRDNRPDESHRGLRVQASSRLVSAPSLMQTSRTVEPVESCNVAGERTNGAECTDPHTSKTQHSFIQDILSHSIHRAEAPRVDRPGKPREPAVAGHSDHQNGHSAGYRRVPSLSERERFPSAGQQAEQEIQKQRHPNLQLSTPRADGTPRPQVQGTQHRFLDPRAPAAPIANGASATPAAKYSHASAPYTPAPVSHAPHAYTPQSSAPPVTRTPAPVSTPAPASVPTPAQAPAPTKQTDRTMPPPSMSISRAASETILLINNRRYKIMKLLGKGGSSRVFEAFDEERNTVVAIKRVDLSNADEAQAAGYLNEINMLKQLQGEVRIVRMFDFEQDEMQGILYVVMEKGDTDLASLLRDYASRREITGTIIKYYWTEMLHAVNVIHKAGIIHSDLKPANFLLVAGRLKLIDFGIASSVKSDQTSVMKDTQMGTFNFMSPEALQELSGPTYDGSGNRKPVIKISFKSDVWSLGCILYNLVYGKMPYGDIKIPIMKIQAILNPDHHIQFPEEGVDPLLIEVLRSCLTRSVKARPSIQELLNHRYVTGVEAPPKVEQIDALKMLAGVLSPATFEKTRRKLQETPSRKLDM